MKKGLLFILTLLIFGSVRAQDYPSKTDNKGNVYDFADLLSTKEEKKLNKIQKKILKKSNVRIWLISVKSMDGIAPYDYTYGIGREWEIDRSKKQILIVLKPKYANEKGEIFIATGFGKIDEYISGQTVSEIIKKSIIPQFKKKEIYLGLLFGIKELQMEINKTVYNKV